MSSVLRHLSAWTNWLIVLAIGVLVTVGIRSIWAEDPDHGAKQLLFAAIGVGALLLLQVIHYQAIGRIAWILHFMVLAAILYTLLPWVPSSGFGSVPLVNGARNWIDFKLLRFQPAEFAKITYVLTLAHYLRFRESQRSYAGLIPPFLLTFIPLLMILKQPDLGTSLVFTPCLFIMLFAAGARTAHLLTVAGAGLLCVPLVWFAGNKGTPVFEHLPAIVKEYQRQRVFAMFSSDPSTLQRSGYQQHNALIAFGSGGLSGKGWGNIEIGHRVPESHNDMIFALIGEQAGFLGVLLVLAAYGALFLAGIETAGSTRDPFGRLAAIGLTAMLAGGAFLNIMVVLKLMPVTGVTLPFISYGGSSLLANFMLAGLLMNIASRRPIVMGKSTFEGEE